MPVDPGDVSVFVAEVHPARRPTVDRDHAQRDPGILRPGKGITMLLDLELGLGLMHDRKDRNLRAVALLAGHHVAGRRWPVPPQSIAFLLGDELSHAIRGPGGM